MCGPFPASGGASLGGPFAGLMLELNGLRVCFVPVVSTRLTALERSLDRQFDEVRLLR
ncbi:MAG: hypothetical protein H0U00_05480 [Actinobacteria bacterium]|nr:hypothetical protein [Actinomycetota bacterium]